MVKENEQDKGLAALFPEEQMATIRDKLRLRRFLTLLPIWAKQDKPQSTEKQSSKFEDGLSVLAGFTSKTN